MATKKLTIIIEKTSTGFSAYAKEIDGLATVGSSLSELKENINEVLQYHIEYLNEQGKALTIENFTINYTGSL